MSTTQPGGPRRRRIAGERRRPGADEELTQPVPGSDRSPRTSTRVDPSGEESVQATPPAAPKTKKTKKTEKPAATAVSSPGKPAGRRTTGWWASRRSLVILAGVFVLLLVLAGLAAVGTFGTDGVQDVQEAEAVEQSMRTAPAAAEAAAAAILAYDHTSLDADQDSASRYMTDEFAAEYAETFEKVVRPAAEANRAKVTATVQASSVISATEDTARVLLFVDQATTSTANERPQIALNRVVMSMVRSDDNWRVADISSY